MTRAKQVSKRKRRRSTLPLLGAAGASLAMAGGSSAAVPTADLPLPRNESLPLIVLDEEELTDVNLGTFYVFDRENDLGLIGDKVAARGCGGCRGGGGCAAARCAAARCASGCAAARCAAGRCAVARCAAGRCGCGSGCGVGVVGCVSCGCSCSGSCYIWDGYRWNYVCY